MTLWAADNHHRLNIPSLRNYLSFCSRAFPHVGSKLLNDLPSKIKDASSTDTIKKLLETHLFENYHKHASKSIILTYETQLLPITAALSKTSVANWTLYKSRNIIISIKKLRLNFINNSLHLILLPWVSLCYSIKGKSFEAINWLLFYVASKFNSNFCH